MLLFTAVLCMKKSYPGNLWSETAAMLGYSELGKNLQVPSTVRVMESISPYGCMLQVFFLLFCYSLTLSFVILVGNLYKGKTKGMIFGLLYSVFGFLLDPKVLAAILHKEKFKYSYGRKYRTHINEAIIKLPIQRNLKGDPIIDASKKYSKEGYIPDWTFMENYIKALPYGDRLNI